MSRKTTELFQSPATADASAVWHDRDAAALHADAAAVGDADADNADAASARNANATASDAGTAAVTAICDAAAAAGTDFCTSQCGGYADEPNVYGVINASQSYGNGIGATDGAYRAAEHDDGTGDAAEHDGR